MPLKQGSRVLVTAGAGGIGKAMGEAFEAAGAQVWVTDVDAPALEACPASWVKTEVDAADEAGVASLFEAIQHRWGGIDVVCANAGVAGPTASIDKMTLEGWRRCVAVNLEGAFLAARAAAPMLTAQGAGAIIFTSSTAGLHGFPNRAPYAAAKWGVIGLMKTVAMELGPHGIRANAICPGAVEGPRIDGVIERAAAAKGASPDALRASIEASYSLRRFVTAQEIADMAVFLASPEAAAVSGQAIAVDGHTEAADPKT